MANETREAESFDELTKSITRRMIQIDPRQLQLLDINARYMRQETYQRLVENIKSDGVLTQDPLIWRIHDDHTQTPTDDEHQYLVLSGNHRTSAAIDAGLTLIDAIAIDEYLTPDRRVALQLSHNAISGEDDPAILKTIYEGIDDVEMRIYSGLDDKTLDLMDKVSIVSISEANLEFQTISMTFLPDEVEQVEAIWESVKKQIAGSKTAYLARWSDYDRFLDGLATASDANNIKNTATALMIVLDVFNAHMSDLTDAFLDAQGEPKGTAKHVPTETILNTYTIPVEIASRIEKITTRLMSQGKLDNENRHEVLTHILDVYDEQHKG